MAKYNKPLKKADIYKTNPSLEFLNTTTKTKKNYLQNGDKALIIDEGTGEFRGNLGAVFLEQKEVDTEQFIKLYTNGVEELANLTGAGFKVFKLVYKIMLQNPNSDIVILDFNALKIENLWDWSQVTFISGLNEMLTKGILFKHYSTNHYFYNVSLFYNGDRVSMMKQYKLKKSDFNLFSK